MTAFIEEYSAARATPLNRAERAQIAAWGLLLATYTARCEHCAIDGYDADRDSFTTALRAYGRCAVPHLQVFLHADGAQGSSLGLTNAAQLADRRTGGPSVARHGARRCPRLRETAAVAVFRVASRRRRRLAAWPMSIRPFETKLVWCHPRVSGFPGDAPWVSPRSRRPSSPMWRRAWRRWRRPCGPPAAEERASSSCPRPRLAATCARNSWVAWSAGPGRCCLSSRSLCLPAWRESPDRRSCVSATARRRWAARTQARCASPGTAC